MTTGITVYTDENGVTREYNEVRRKANVGELVKVVEADVTFGYYKNDDIFTVRRRCANRGIIIDGTAPFINDYEYVVLEPVEAVTEQSLTDNDRITQLEQRVAELEKQLKQRTSWLNYGGVISEAIEQTIDPVETVVPLKPQYTREQVIELAKNDAAELKRDYYLHNVKVRVNRKYRVVVATVEAMDGKREGRAQCAADDCFNVHIGTALAMRRALGLDVPQYYIDAPVPTEPQVGDVVTFPDVKDTSVYHVITTEDTFGNLNIVKSTFSFLVGKSAYVDNFENAIILDDSHDFGGEGQ